MQGKKDHQRAQKGKFASGEEARFKREAVPEAEVRRRAEAIGKPA